MKKSILITICLFTLVTFISNTNLTSNVNKVVFEIFELNNLSTETEVKEEISKVELINVLVKLKYDEFKYDFKSDANTNSFEVNDDIATSRELGRQYHFNNNLKAFKSLKVEGYVDYYVSEYLPYIEYIFEPDTLIATNLKAIKSLNDSDEVEQIYLKDPNEQKEPLLYDSLHDINAYDNWRYGTYGGYGVKVGMLETGVVDTSHFNIHYSYITIKPDSQNVITEHATMMAAIIGASVGVAFDSKLYSAAFNGLYTDSLDWLIDCGVHVINVSAYLGEKDGSYSAVAAMFDYTVYTYGVTICAASGNDGFSNGYVVSPSLGYNVMSVGAGHSPYTNVFIMTSTKTLPNSASKPNIIFPGAFMEIPTFPDSNEAGTSISSAYAAGMAAVLMEYNSTYKTNPMALMTRMMASCYQIPTFTSTDASGLNYHAGAGGFMFDYFMNNTVESGVATVFNTNTNYTLIEILVYLDSCDTATFCVGWLANATGAVSGTTLTNIDISIRDTASSTIYAQTSATTNNIEILRYYNNTSETRMIRFRITLKSNPQVGLRAYYAININN